MNSEMILKTDILDILFEKRNKLYGAYTLRKFYPDRVKTSLLIMLGLVLIFCVFAFIPKNAKDRLFYTVIDGPAMASVNPDIKKPEPELKKSSGAIRKINADLI